MSTEITIKEAAISLGISEQRIRTLCREKKLISRRVGNSWLIDKASLSNFGLVTAHHVVKNHSIQTPRTKKPIALSFFSGALGLDQGIEKAGFEIRLACEIDKYSRQTIALNRPNVALIGDLTEYTSSEILSYAGLSKSDDIDLIMGGSPCQAFSTAGKRNGLNDHRGNVFLNFLDIALTLKPKVLVIENVRGLLSCPMKHRPHEMRGNTYPDLTLDELPGGALNFILSIIEKAGYSYSFNLYNTANFGVPQIRERVVIVCSRGSKKPPFLEPTHSEDRQFGLKPWRTFKQATLGLSKHTHINFPEKRLVYYRMIKEGQNWKSLSKKMQKEALGQSFYAGGGKTGFLRRLAWNKPSPTLVTHPAMPATDLAHPVEDRPLSIEEYKRIQEFPDNWNLAGPLIEQYKQVGNAVPVGFGFAIGQLVMKLISNEKNIQPTLNGFNYSRYKATTDTEWRMNFAKLSKSKTAVQQSLF